MMINKSLPKRKVPKPRKRGPAVNLQVVITSSALAFILGLPPELIRFPKREPETLERRVPSLTNGFDSLGNAPYKAMHQEDFFPEIEVVSLDEQFEGDPILSALGRLISGSGNRYA